MCKCLGKVLLKESLKNIRESNLLLEEYSASQITCNTLSVLKTFFIICHFSELYVPSIFTCVCLGKETEI